MSRFSFKTAILSVTLLVLFGPAAFLASSGWRSLGPWAGISITAAAIDPLNPSILYAGMYGRVMKSIDGGSNWFAASKGLPQDSSTDSLTVCPQHPAHIYVVMSAGIYETKDGGSSWTKMPGDVPTSVRRIFIPEPGNESTLLALGSSGLFKSLDGGAHWMEVYQLWFGDLAVDPHNPEVLYFGGDQHFLKSVDGGISWTALNIGETGYYQIKSIAVDPNSPDVVYAVCQNLNSTKAYKSIDGGAGWSVFYDPGTLNYPVVKLVIDPQNSNILYMAGSTPGVAWSRKSQDGGRTWTTLWEADFSAREFIPIHLFDPQRSTTIYQTYPSDGFRRSYDGGDNWYAANGGLLRASVWINDLDFAASGSTAALYAVSSQYYEGGIFRSENGGVAWVPKNTGLNLWYNGMDSTSVGQITIDPRNPAIAYAIQTWYYYKYGEGYHSLYKSTDGGESWTKLYQWPGWSAVINTPPGVGVRRLVVDPGNSSTLYVATSLGVQKSTDGGTNWQEMNAGLANFDSNDLIVHPQTAGLLFAGTAGGVFKSIDGGTNWTAANKGLGDLHVRVLLLISGGSTALYAGTASGLYKSVDLGATWTAAGSGLGNSEITALAADPLNTSILYAGTNAGGVYRSADGGVNWAAFNDNLDDLKINCLAVDPKDPAHVYAGTRSGVYSTYDPPRLFVSPNHLHIGQVYGQPAPAPQTVQIRNLGQGLLNWAISGLPPWSQTMPTAGTGNGRIAVGVDTAGLQAGSYSGSITISAPDAADSPRSIIVYLEIFAPGTSKVPFGFFDTPVNNSNVSSSIAVTGWALDDIEVMGVKIFRDPVGAEPAGSRVYIGDGIFSEGARPDVETAFPNYPLKTRAGWGYMMLTNFLPNGGNGTFTIYAYATDREGHEVQLGSKTITCDNANAVKPFGAIDLPAQGETISGAAYINGGWALTPPPNVIPTDGSTLMLWVDGLPIGRPSYNHYRGDIATLFPGYANSNGAAGVFTLDTTSFANKVYTIEWSVRDNAGNEDGIGSRFFSILNPGTPMPQSEAASRGSLTALLELAGYKDATQQPLYSRKGSDRRLPPDRIFPTSASIAPISQSVIPRQTVIPTLWEGPLIVTRELERLEILLDERAWSADAKRRTRERAGLESTRTDAQTRQSDFRWEGYLIVGDELRSLPIGSTLDASFGIFSWLPGPGFLGDYRLVFVNRERKDKSFLTIRIEPRYSKIEE